MRSARSGGSCRDVTCIGAMVFVGRYVPAYPPDPSGCACAAEVMRARVAHARSPIWMVRWNGDMVSVLVRWTNLLPPRLEGVRRRVCIGRGTPSATLDTFATCG
jgi:hypothetical protein